MTSPADGLRRIADRARAIPGRMGLREHSVALLTSAWSGAQPGDGLETSAQLPILVGPAGSRQNPRVRWLHQKELAIGNLPAGTVEIGPFTPSHRSGGVDVLAILGTALQQGETRFLWIQGPRLPDGQRYRVTQIAADHALQIKLQAEPAG